MRCREGGDGDARREAKRRNQSAFQGTLDHPRVGGLPVCTGSLGDPPSSRPLVEIGVVIVGICSVCVHPREFLFVSSNGFVRQPVPAPTDDAIEPFARDP